MENNSRAIFENAWRSSQRLCSYILQQIKASYREPFTAVVSVRRHKIPDVAWQHLRGEAWAQPILYNGIETIHRKVRNMTKEKISKNSMKRKKREQTVTRRTHCTLHVATRQGLVVACRRQFEGGIRLCMFCRFYHTPDPKTEDISRCIHKQLVRSVAPRTKNRICI